jgi:hypothetical protein
MVTSLNSNVPAREAGYEMAQYISKRIAADGSVNTAVRVGTIPIGSMITQIFSKVTTAFIGGTPLLTLGQFGDAGLDNLVVAMAETAGSEVVQALTTITQPLTADLDVWANIGGTATAGEAYIAIEFIKPIA